MGQRERAQERAATAATATGTTGKGPVIEEVLDDGIVVVDTTMSPEQHASDLDRRLTAERDELLEELARAKRANTSP